MRHANSLTTSTMTKNRFEFKEDADELDQNLIGAAYRLRASSGVFKGTFGLLLERKIGDEQARWFFSGKSELSSANIEHLKKGLKDPAFAQQFFRPLAPEALLDAEKVMQAASVHFSGAEVVQAGSADAYPPAWASMTVITVNTVANKDVLKKLKGVNGIRLGKLKDKTYLVADTHNCPPHLANQALLNCLSVSDLMLLPKKLIDDSFADSVFPKLSRPAIAKPYSKQLDKDHSTLKADIEAIKALHPLTVDQALSFLKSGIDQYTRMKGEALVASVTPDALEMINRRLTQQKSRENAMRWVLRGLSADLATRKVQLMAQSRDYFTNAYQSGNSLFKN